MMMVGSGEARKYRYHLVATTIAQQKPILISSCFAAFEGRTNVENGAVIVVVGNDNLCFLSFMIFIIYSE